MSTRASLVSQRVRLNEDSDDNVGVVMAFDATSRIARVQKYSGKIVTVHRSFFETIGRIASKREDEARSAIRRSAAAQQEGVGVRGEDAGDDDTVVSVLSMTSDVNPTLSIAAAPKPRVLAITGRKEDGDVPVEMGKFGKEFMGGEDRYSRIAVKYVSL